MTIFWSLFIASLFVGIDVHRHHCACGHLWWHLGLVSAGDIYKPRAVKAHTCARCGEQVWIRGRRDDDRAQARR